ncbi:MAG: hypothetical protein KBT61_02630 [Paraperlucidibaca sp.]|jgi:hypothetical protein|nr:hypothetical protein [Paraperlucidibaca sp.]MBQ0723282.1 hypothetical protein [Paraperlucidibaca sp.]MBQ0841836.1 hypothetical protein [Paraperlucidibaca sp.]|tara:strand:- start:2116 stop:3081 length:966 start_codon:yes stop_codon:yes gene_type:complete
MINTRYSMRPGLRLAAVVLTSLISSTAWSHAAHNEDRRASIDPLPNALKGVTVQLVETLGAQLVIDNKTAKPLVILANDGKPFLRVSSAGVDANVRHQTWLDSYLPGGLPHRKTIDGEGDKADWRMVRKTSHWGWFDERLKVENAKGDSWRIPVRYGDVDAVISGKFVAALANGLWQSSWQSAPKLPKGVSILLIPGQPFGLMLSNSSRQTVEVLDDQKQPFLRLNAKGTFANTHSALWQKTAVQSSLRQAQAQAWQKISATPRYTWVEPRTLPAAGASTKAVQRWNITLLIDGKATVLNGQSRWVKAPKRDTAPTTTQYQ